MMLDVILENKPWLYDLSITGLGFSIVAGLTAALLSIGVLAINVIGRRWLTASQMAFLWGLVILRMLIPAAPESPLSVQNVFVRAESWLTSSSQQESATASVVEPASSDHADMWDAEAPAVAPASPPDSTTSSNADPEMWLPLIWQMGALVILISTLVRHVLFSRRVAKTEVCHDPRLLGLLEDSVSMSGMRRTPRLLLFDGVSQPAVMGIFRPRLLLPPDIADLGDSQLRMIMLHELMHLKRFDTAKAWGQLLVRAAQWWNPFYWLASMRYLNLREQACDAAVLKRLSNAHDDRNAVAKAYSELLLALSSRGEQGGWRVMLPASLLSFTSGRLQKRAIANRLRAVRQDVRPQHRQQLAIVVVTISTVACAGFTDAMTPPSKDVASPPGPQALALKAGESYGPPPRKPVGDWTQQRYDITRAVRRVASLEGIPSDEAAEKCWTLLHHVGSFSVDRMKSVSPTRCWRKPTPKPNDARSTHVEGEPEEPGTAILIVSSDGENWHLDLSAPQGTHDLIQCHLRAWERSGLKQVSIETRVIWSNRDVVARARMQWDSLLRVATTTPEAIPTENLNRADGESVSASAVSSVQEQIPVLVSQLTADESRQFVEAAQSHERADIIFAPKVTLFNGQQGTISTAVYRPFVTGVTFDENEAQRPQVDEIEEGLQIELDSVCNSDGTAVDLSSRFTFRDISDVHTFTTKLRHQKVHLQLPRVTECRINVAATIPDDGSLLIGLPPAYERTQYTYVMLTPRILTEEMLRDSSADAD